MKLKRIAAGFMAAAVMVGALPTGAFAEITNANIGSDYIVDVKDILPQGVDISSVYGARVYFTEESADVIMEGAGGGFVFNTAAGWNQMAWCNGCGDPEEHELQYDAATNSVTRLDSEPPILASDLEEYFAQVCFMEWWGGDITVDRVELVDKDGKSFGLPDDYYSEVIGYTNTYIRNNGGEWNWYGGESVDIKEFKDTTGKLPVYMTFSEAEAETLAAPVESWEKYPEIGIEVASLLPKSDKDICMFNGEVTDIVVTAGDTAYEVEGFTFANSVAPYVDSETGDVRAVLDLSINDYVAKAVGIDNPESDEYLEFLKTVTEVSAKVEVYKLSVEEPVTPENGTIKVHYYRPDGDYTDWDVYCWDDEDNTYSAEFEIGSDEFAVATIDVPSVREYGFLIRLGGDEWLEKDVSVDRFITADMFKGGVAEIWLISGDKTVYTKKPDTQADPDEPSDGNYEAWMFYASAVWHPSALTNDTSKVDNEGNTELSWKRYNASISKDGTYSIGLGEFLSYGVDEETGEAVTIPTDGYGTTILTIEIEELASALGIGKGSAAYDALGSGGLYQEKMQIAKDAGINITDVTLVQVSDGIVTKLAVDDSKIFYGDLEGNGKLRIELFNEYGPTSGDKPFDKDGINFDEKLMCNFTITGIDAILNGDKPEPEKGKYNAYLGFQTAAYSFREMHHNISYGENTKYFHEGVIVWGGNDPETYPEYADYYDYDLEGYLLPAKFTDAQINSNGTYSVKVDEDVFTWELDGPKGFNMLWLDTDIPADIGAKITDIKLLVDGNTVMEYDGEPLTEDEAKGLTDKPAAIYDVDSIAKNNTLSVMLTNIWNDCLDSYLGEYPTDSVEIQFTVDIPGIEEETNEGRIIINYYRPDWDFTGWNIYYWYFQNDVCIEGTEDFVYTPDYDFAIATIDVPAVGDYGFCVRRSDESDMWLEKDPDIDRFITADMFKDGVAEIWVVSGDENVYTEMPDIAIPDYRVIGEGSLYIQNQSGAYDYFAGETIPIYENTTSAFLFMPVDETITDRLEAEELYNSYPRIGLYLKNYDASYKNGAAHYLGTILATVTAGGKEYELDIRFAEWVDAMTGPWIDGYINNVSIDITGALIEAAGLDDNDCYGILDFMKTITGISAKVTIEEFFAFERDMTGGQIYVQQRSGDWMWFSGEYGSIKNTEEGNNTADLYFKVPSEAYDYMTAPENGDKLYPAIGVLINQFAATNLGERVKYQGYLRNISFVAGGKVYKIDDIEINKIIELCPAEWNTEVIDGVSFSVVLNDYIAEVAGIANAECDEFIEFIKTITEISLTLEATECRLMESDEKCEHKFGEWVVASEATCTEDGVKERVCEICGEIETEVIPATGHTWTEWEETTPATCTEDGKKQRKCEVCGEIETEVIPATGHTYPDVWTVDAEPTCTEAGSKSHHCINCDAKTDVTEIPATGHKFVDKVVDATYTEKGYTLHTCSVCGYSYKDNETPKLKLAKITGFKASAKSDTTITLKWNKNSEATGYILEQYKGNKWVRIAKITSNATTTYKVSKLTAVTRYPFRIQAYKEIGKGAVKSAYTNKLIVYTNPKKVTSFKAASKSDSVIRLNWAKNTTATGYIIEQYKGNKWVRIAKITNNSTTELRLTELSPATRYAFRIQAYKNIGSGAVKSTYTDKLIVYTNPKAMSGFKASSKTDDTITLSWNKNTSATGYIVEQYKGNKWVRIAKLTNNSTTSLKVTGLKANTRYAFRIQAYKNIPNGGAVKSAYTGKLVVYTSK